MERIPSSSTSKSSPYRFSEATGDRLIERKTFVWCICRFERAELMDAGDESVRTYRQDMGVRAL